ncbi:fimbrial protein [Enterobacter cloacae complex sp. P40RS]|uniref:Fimbrial protein n=2 Tax=Enterobacter TaxID=547 RepID=A0ABR9Q8H2_9ENTR|nr:fimbrial protein [Enterobacter pasteurii]MBE4862388.1 fimbrial protein [Enterobacter cloacae complex sp. P40C2]MBE4878669.1 fimbrial protein [Enterobacter cloacae complex sp. P40C]
MRLFEVKMNIFRYAFALAVLLSGACLMPHAQAATTCDSTDLPYTLDAGTLSVPTTLDIGGIIPGSAKTHTVNGSCVGPMTNHTIISCYYGTGTEVPGMPGVYSTNVDGIGIELLNSNGQIVRGKGYSCDTSATPVGTVSSDSGQTFSFSYTQRLIKTASHIGSGTLSVAMDPFGFGVFRSVGISGARNTSHYSATVSERTATCSIDPLNLTVSLGDFPVSQFTHVGSYTAWKYFSITATCTEEVNLTASVTSANGVNGQFGDVLNLTPGSDSATGVGVRMLLDGVDLKYDFPIPVGGRTAPDVPDAIPFAVQYYQTDATVTAGKANTIATIDLEYQ